MHAQDTGAKYVTCLYFVTTVFTTVGFGACVQECESEREEEGVEMEDQERVEEEEEDEEKRKRSIPAKSLFYTQATSTLRT